MRKRDGQRRLLALCLCLALSASSFPGVAFAGEEPICINHPEHDESCGFAENQACSHVCDLCAEEEKETAEGDMDGSGEVVKDGETEGLCTQTEGCQLIDGHEGTCILAESPSEPEKAPESGLTPDPENAPESELTPEPEPGAEQESELIEAAMTMASENDIVTGDGYSFDRSTGTLTAFSNDGSRNWRKNTDIALNEEERLNAVKTAIIDTDAVRSEAFYGCGSLTNVIMKGGVNALDRDAFTLCSKLLSVTFEGNHAPTLEGGFESVFGPGSASGLMKIYLNIGADGFTKDRGWPELMLVYDQYNATIDLTSFESLEEATIATFGSNSPRTIRSLTIVGQTKDGWWSYDRERKYLVNNFVNLEELNMSRYWGRMGDRGLMSASFERIRLDPDMEFGPSLFSYCKNLKTVVFGDGEFTEGVADFTGYRGHVNKTTEEKIAMFAAMFNASGVSTVRLRKDIPIAEYMFSDCNQLTTLVIGDGKFTQGVIDLTGYTGPSYGAQAFYGATTLKEVWLPTGVPITNRYAFNLNHALETLVFVGRDAPATNFKTSAFPEKMTIYYPQGYSGYEGMFQYEREISYVGYHPTINVSTSSSLIKVLEEMAFTKPEEVTGINIVGGKGQLLYGVVLASRLPKLEELDLSKYEGEFAGNAFVDCGVKKVRLAENAQLSNNMFALCKKLTTLVLGDGEFTDGVIDLSNYQWTYCEAGVFSGSGVRSVRLASNMQMGDSMFKDCTQLFSLTVGDGPLVMGVVDLTEYQGDDFGDSLFANDRSIERVLLPTSVPVGQLMFYNCTNMKLLQFRGGNAPEVGIGAFADVPKGTLCYPAGAAGYTSDWLLNAWLSGWTLNSIGADTLNLTGFRDLRQAVEASGFDSESTRRITVVGKAELGDWDMYDGRYVAHTFSGLTELDMSGYTGGFGQGAFSELSGLKRVRLPENVEITERMFNRCANLTTLVVGDGNFTDDVIDLTSYKSLTFGEHAFESCGAEEVWFGGSAPLAPYLFFGCKNLNKLTFTTLRVPIPVRDAFSAVADTGEVRYPAGVQEYDQHWLNNMELSGWTLRSVGVQTVDLTGKQSLEEAVVKTIASPEGVDSLAIVGETVGGQWTQSDRNYLNQRFTILSELDLSGYTGAMTEKAFSESSVKRLRLPADMVIAQGMFEKSGNLATLTFGDKEYVEGVIDLSGYRADSYGSGAFAESGAKEVHLFANVTISQDMFRNCNNLRSLAFVGGDAPSAEAGAFSNVSDTGIVWYPVEAKGYHRDWLNGIGLSGWRLQPVGTIEGEGYDFKPAEGLLTITSDQGTTNWRSDVDIDKSNVREVRLEGVSSIGADAFRDCASLTEAEIPASVTCIGENAFRDCESLSEIIVRNGEAVFGTSAFAGCKSLTTLMVGNGIVNDGVIDLTGYLADSCGASAFADSGAKEVWLSAETVVSVDMFRNCNDLNRLKFIGDRAPMSGAGAFAGVSPAGEIRYPAGVSGYTQAWLDSIALSDWELIPVGVITGDQYTFDPQDGSLTVTGDQGTTNWRSHSEIAKSDVRQVYLQGVAVIGTDAFRDCIGLSSLEIPANVVGIGESAFRDCTGLSKVIIGNGGAVVGVSAFAGCKSLTTLMIGDGPATDGVFNLAGYTQDAFGKAVFSGSGVKEVRLPVNAAISEDMFRDCNNLSRITFTGGDAPAAIRGAFEGVSAIGEVWYSSGAKASARRG